MENLELKRLKRAAIFPIIAVLLLIGIHALQLFVLGQVHGISTGKLPLNDYGMKPWKAEGLLGIFTMPFLHGSWNHLYNNITSLFVLLWAMNYFYKELMVKTILAIMIFGGVWVWFGGKYGTNHVGASGLIYGLASFLFLSGVVRRYIPLVAISLMVVFLYGGMIWGIFPIKEGISWEGHLWGGVAGIVMAIYYRMAGPQRKEYEWDDDDDIDEDDPEAYWNRPLTDTPDDRPRVVYHWKRRGKG